MSFLLSNIFNVITLSPKHLCQYHAELCRSHRIPGLGGAEGGLSRDTEEPIVGFGFTTITSVMLFYLTAANKASSST
jgi:hypothetical protein